MNQTYINFTASNQHLSIQGEPLRLASKTVNFVKAHFELGENWDGFDSVRAVWSTDFNKGVSAVLDSLGDCVVPHEVLTRVGKVRVNLVGSISEDDVLTDRLTTCLVSAIEVCCNVPVDGTNPQTITPTQFEQFVEAVRDDADRAETASTEARESATEASESATSASQSASASAESATASEQAKDLAQAFAQNAQISAQTAENAKDDAELARDEILGMRAEAVTLPEGSEATASYADGLLSLGIPRGNTGAKGDKGDTGETGATPNLTIGNVETLEPSEPATATITGTAENPVLNLGIPQGDTGDVSQAQLDEAVTDLKSEISDITDEITTNKTASGTLIKIDEQSPFPISVSGQGESETVYVTSANLFDISLIPDRSGLLVNHGTYLTITQNPSGERVNCLKKLSELCPTLKIGDVVYIKADTTGSNKYVYFNANSTTVYFGQSFTVTQNFLNSYMYFVASGASTSADISNIMVCFDVTDAYEAYNTEVYADNATTLENNINFVFGSSRSALSVTYKITRFDDIYEITDDIVHQLGKQATAVGHIITINDAISGNVISESGSSVGEKVYVGSRNLFDISVIPDTAGKVVNNGDSLTITQSTSGGVNVLKTLKDICKGLREGDVVTINGTTSGLAKVYLASGDSWDFGTRKTVTSAMLANNCWVYFYANGEGTTTTVSNIQVWFGKAVGDYEPCITKEYVSGTDTIKLNNGENVIWSANDNELAITYNASTITEASDGVANYSRWKGKRCLVLGDSISADNYLTYPSWASLMGDYFGMELVNPSVHAVGYVCGVDTPTPNENSLINLLETLHTQYPNNDDFDLIVFFRGTNDFGNSIPIGSSGDSKTASFTGAVEWCFKYANDNWSKARIVVFTPMQRITGQVANSASAKLEDYADVIRSKANAIGFDVLDLFNKSGFSVLYNPFGEYASGYNDFAQQYCLETPEHNPDGLHPNKLFTDTRLFPQISEFIKGV